MKRFLILYLLVMLTDLTPVIAQINWVLDSSFADGGELVLDIDELDDFSGLVYDDNNNTYFYGASGNYTTFIDYDFVIGKINQFGILDSTFGDNGLFKGDFYNQVSSHIVEAFYSNGHITFLAQSQTPSSLDTSFIAIGRIDTLGNIDSTFGVNGVFGGPFIGIKTQPNGLDEMSDGSMIFTGTTFDSAYAHRELALVGKLSSQGLPDSSFGGTGFLTWDYIDGLNTAQFIIPNLYEKHELGSSFSCAVENPWGDYLIGGYLDVGNYVRCLAVRISTSGNLVSSFGYGGYFSFDHMPDNNNYIIDMKNWNGKVLITANEYAENDFILTSISETSAVSTWSDIDIQGNTDVGKSLYIDSANNVYVTGFSKDPSLTGPGYSSQFFTMLKLNEDLTVDTNFADNGFFKYDFQTGDEHGCSDFGFNDQNIILGGYLNNYNAINYTDFGFVRLKKTITAVSITESKNHEMEVYPNPGNDYVYVTTTLSLGKLICLELYSVSGQKIKSYKFSNTGDSYRMNISDLSNGVYILKGTSEGIHFNQKIIKK